RYDPCEGPSHLARSRERERRRKPRASPKGTAAQAAKRLRDQKSPRWSAGGAPPSLRGQVPHWCPACQRHGTQTGCSRGTRAPTGAPPSPLSGRGNDATRPRSDAGDERKEKWEWRNRERERESEE